MLFSVVAVLAIPSVGWWYWPTRLPHPDHCNRDQLLRWIALRDVGAESIETQRALVRRFQDLLLADPSSATMAIDPAYQTQVDRNRTQLQDLWFYDCVDKYHQLDVAQRPEFVDWQLRTAITWQSIQSTEPATANPSEVSPISNAVTHWIDSARDTERGRIVAVLAAATVRWLSIHDAATLSKEARRSFAVELVDQLQRPSVAPVIAGSAMLDVESAEMDQLLRNVELLLEAWFHEQARRYGELGKAERERFVKDKVAMVRQSPLLSMLSDNGEARSSPLVQVLRIQQMIQGWIQRADRGERPLLQEFSSAVYREVIAGFTQSR